MKCLRFYILGLTMAAVLSACNDAKVTVSGLKAVKFNSPAPPSNSIGSARPLLSGGAYAMQVQASGKSQQQLSGGPYQMTVEITK